MVNEPLTLIEAGTTITASTSFEVDCLGARGVLVSANVTAVDGTNPTLDIKLQRINPVDGKEVDLAGGALAQITEPTAKDLVVYPGVAETANVSVSDHCGRRIKVVCAVEGTNPEFTLSLGVTRLV